MIERLSVAVLAVLTLLALWLAPWATITREIGADGALLLLPNRIMDFTGDLDGITVPFQLPTLGLSALALAALVLAAGLRRGEARYGVWLIAGLLLIGTTTFGLSNLQRAVEAEREGELVRLIERSIERPRANTDVAALEALVADAETLSFEELLEAADQSGVRVRRLPFEGAGANLAAFLSLVTGGLAVFLGLRFWPRTGRLTDRLIATVAVPASSILLALLAAAVVVLLLQPTPHADDVQIDTVFMVLAGRLDTLWYAYQTLFADSLGTVRGFMESLKFATPLIFTGLAVAFAFRAGLFNIGAPGQMVLGAVFAMLVGLYVPGPRVLVLPLAVAASALGGGLWGALPGWLKARFGANEVINTILLNYIAASLLLFLLSANHTFAAPAWYAILFLAGVAVAGIILSLFPAVRREFSRAPRPIFAVAGVLVVAGIIGFGLLAQGADPFRLELPFKAPGSEPKSYPLSAEARIPQVPALAGIDTRTSPGLTVVPINYAPAVAAALALLAFAFAPRVHRQLSGPWTRLALALAAGLLGYGLAALVGLTAYDTVIPPTNLNASFVVALVAAVFMYYFLWRTKWGYELRAVGLAPRAAEYGGANIARNVVLAMTISGAFAGLTATHYVLGGALEDYSLRQSLPTSDGFDGIAVALLGGNTPVGVILSAFLFGVLKNGGSILNITFSDLTRDVVNMILALVVLFIAARGFLPERLTDPLRRGTPAYGGLDTDSKEPLDAPGRPERSSQELRSERAEE